MIDARRIASWASIGDFPIRAIGAKGQGKPGDWLITELDGEQYFLTDEEFHQEFIVIGAKVARKYKEEKVARKTDLDLGVPGVTAEEDEDFIYLHYRGQVETFNAKETTLEKLREVARYMVRVGVIAVGVKSYSVALTAYYKINVQAASEEEAEQKASDLWGIWETPGAADANLELCEVIEHHPVEEEIITGTTWRSVQSAICQLQNTLRYLDLRHFPTRRQALAAILDVLQMKTLLEELKGEAEQ